MSLVNEPNLYKSKRRKVELRVTNAENEYNKIESVKTSAPSTSAVKLNTPENARSFTFIHHEAGAFVYMGDNVHILIDGSNTYKHAANTPYKFNGKKSNNNDIYVIASSGTISVYVIGNY